MHSGKLDLVASPSPWHRAPTLGCISTSLLRALRVLTGLSDSIMVVQGLTGRFYEGRPIQVEFSPVTDFREATCRQYEENTCTRGGCGSTTIAANDCPYNFIREAVVVHPAATPVFTMLSWIMPSLACLPPLCHHIEVKRA